MAFMLFSPAFHANGEIPKMYTCDGQDISPPLNWQDIPEGTQSFALIVDDPDAPDPRSPKMTWVHWILYNIPPTVTGLPQDAASQGLPTGTCVGQNDWNRADYGGPCPPKGLHRYYHKLYALDIHLPSTQHLTKPALEAFMKDHIRGYAELIGMYQRF